MVKRKYRRRRATKCCRAKRFREVRDSKSKRCRIMKYHRATSYKAVRASTRFKGYKTMKGSGIIKYRTTRDSGFISHRIMMGNSTATSHQQAMCRIIRSKTSTAPRDICNCGRCLAARNRCKNRTRCKTPKLWARHSPQFAPKATPRCAKRQNQWSRTPCSRGRTEP